MNRIGYRQVGIIGAGRVARAFALGLHRHSKAPPRLWARAPHPARRAIDDAAETDLAPILRDCDLIAIAVSDDALAEVISNLADALPAGRTPFVFHVSGRSGAAILDPLRAAGAVTAAIHPVMTFTGDPAAEVQRMAAARFAVTGSTAAATQESLQLVARLGGIAVEVAEDKRALYHAGLCHAANHLVTLIAGASHALRDAGIDDPAALLAPLVHAALDNSLAQGFGALSGPLLRGDERTIGGHLDALAAATPALLPAYRAMALATLDELGRTGPSDLRRRLGDDAD